VGKLECASKVAELLAESTITSTRTPSVQTPALETWSRLLRGHAELVRDLSADLTREHGLTINDYEALLLLGHADGGCLSRTELVGGLKLTASGVTRLLEGLEAEGFVARAACASDGRVAYAVLTDAGRIKLEESSRSHLAAIADLFEERYTQAELETLAALLGRLPGAAGGTNCGAP